MYSAKMKNFLIAAVALLSLALCGAAFATDIKELTAAAEAGDAEAQYFLGIRYENGDIKKVYLTENNELGTDATNPVWIENGRAVPCEYGIYPLTKEETNKVEVAN